MDLHSNTEIRKEKNVVEDELHSTTKARVTKELNVSTRSENILDNRCQSDFDHKFVLQNKSKDSITDKVDCSTGRLEDTICVLDEESLLFKDKEKNVHHSGSCKSENTTTSEEKVFQSGKPFQWIKNIPAEDERREFESNQSSLTQSDFASTRVKNPSALQKYKEENNDNVQLEMLYSNNPTDSDDENEEVSQTQNYSEQLLTGYRNCDNLHSIFNSPEDKKRANHEEMLECDPQANLISHKARTSHQGNSKSCESLEQENISFLHSMETR